MNKITIACGIIAFATIIYGITILENSIILSGFVALLAIRFFAILRTPKLVKVKN